MPYPDSTARYLNHNWFARMSGSVTGMIALKGGPNFGGLFWSQLGYHLRQNLISTVSHKSGEIFSLIWRK